MRQTSEDMTWFEAQDPAYLMRSRRYRNLPSDEAYLRRALKHGPQANDDEITCDMQQSLAALQRAGNGRTFFY